MTTLTTSVEPLDDNKVRLTVAVPADEFEKAIDAAFRKLAPEVRIPGFRPGKAPRAAPRGPARHRGGARAGAARRASRVLRRRGRSPRTSTSSPPPRSTSPPGETSATSSSTPSSRSARSSTLAATTSSQVEVDVRARRRCRGRRADRRARATASPTSRTRPRPLIDGDFAEIDINGSVDGEAIDALSATDYLYEVGVGTLVPELDAQLRGKKPGDILEVRRRRSPSGSATAAGDRGLVPRPREGREAQGASRADRRVGHRGERVRHDRRRSATTSVSASGSSPRSRRR